MKKLAVTVVVIALLAGLAWQNKVELLVWGLPKVRDLTAPIPPTELVTYGRLSPPGPGVSLEQIERIYPLFRQSA